MGTAIPYANADDTKISASNNRIVQFINMAKNKSGDNTNLDLSKISKSDAQFLGVYLSNFLLPYATAIEGNDEVVKEVKTRMKEHLVSSLGLREADAIVIVDWVVSEMKNSAQDLEWGFTDKSNAEDSSGMVKPGTALIPATHYEVQKMIAGEFMVDRGMLGLNSESNISEISKSTGEQWINLMKKYGNNRLPEFFYKEVDGNNRHYAYLLDKSGNPVFSLDVTRKQMTASVASLMQAAAVADPVNGYGTNFFDMTIDELNAKKDAGEESSVKLDESDSVLKSKLQVDTFGNILQKGENTTIVILPGASNPFMWKMEGKAAGEGLSATNALVMASSARGGISSYNGGVCNMSTSLVEEKRNALKDDGATDAKIKDVVSFTFAMGTAEHNFRQDGFKGFMLRPFFTSSNEEGKSAKSILQTISDEGTYYVDIEGTDSAHGTLPTYYFGASRPDDGAHWDSTAVPCTGNVIVYDKDALFNSKVVKDYKQVGSKSSTEKEEQGTATKEDSNSGTVDGLVLTNALHSDGTVSASGTGGNFSAKADLMSQGLKISGEDKTLKSIADTTKVFDDYTAFSVYLTYLVSNFGTDEEKASIGVESNSGSNGMLKSPPISDKSAFKVSEEAKKANEEALKEDMEVDIIQWVWHFLNPSKDAYSTQLMTNKMSATILDWHNKLIGVTDSNVLAGTTRYTGISGYITTPKITDIEITKTVYDWYYKYFTYIVLAIVVIMILYWALNQLTFREAALGVAMFTILASIPFAGTNTVIDFSNRINDRFYSDKVLYWALYQNQAYSDEIDSAATGDSYENYLQAQLNQLGSVDINGGEDDTSNTLGGDNILVKWQAPKKMNSMVLGNGEMDEAVAKIAGKNQVGALGINAANSKMSGESYLGTDSTYLYRSYIDLNNFSRYGYAGFTTGVASYNPSPSTQAWVPQLAKAYGDYPTNRKDSEQLGYSHATNGVLRYAPFMSSSIVDDALANNNLGNLTQSDNVGIDTRSFNFGIPNFTKNSDIMATVETNANARAGANRLEARVDGFTADQGKGYNTEDYYGLGAYALYSESPFYYNAWNLYDQGVSSTGGSEGYKNLLLGTADSNYFYNTEGNGGMRDYMDIRTLFTLVIPRLNQGNQIVRDFDRTYGLKYEQGIPTTEGHWNDAGIKDNPDMAQKYWKNLQISRLYGLYSPWVDQLYATKYAESETIDFQGEKVIIDNPLDPSTYPEDRPMVFSESEMLDYGLERGQLTQAENAILDIESNQMDNMIDLLNYYNFNDNVLTTASAMMATFEFNRAFSDTRLFGESITLYPQAFEQKNFSFDVYLRMLLATNTDEDIASTSGSQFYKNLVSNTGIVTPVLLLVADVIAGIGYPLMRVLIIALLVILMSLNIYLLCIKAKTGSEALKEILSTVIKPLLVLLAVTALYGVCFSFFMTSGSKQVTGDTEFVMNLGSPLWTLTFLCIASLIMAIFLWRLGVSVIDDTKSAITATYSSVQGLGGSAVKFMNNVSSGMTLKEARANIGSQVSSSGVSATSNTSTGTANTSGADSNVSSGNGFAGAGVGVLGGRGTSESKNSHEPDYNVSRDDSMFSKRSKKKVSTTKLDETLLKDIKEKSESPKQTKKVSSFDELSEKLAHRSQGIGAGASLPPQGPTVTPQGRTTPTSPKGTAPGSQPLTTPYTATQQGRYTTGTSLTKEELRKRINDMK